MQSLKHVGRIKASNKKCLVAFRTLPGDAYSCLVIPTENMPDEMHNAIINLVESPAAQEAYEFAEALDRTQFPDGSRMLPALHVQGRLVKLRTQEVEMTPTVNASVLLSELNQIIAEQRGIPVDELCIKPGSQDAQPVKEILPAKEDVSKTTSSSVNSSEETTTSQETDNSPEAQAKRFRSEADRLSKQAAEMRRKAEELAPTKKKTKELA
jgi:hypothetical protein